MDAFVGWFWGTGWFWVVVFWVGLVVNGRAVFKLLLDWRGMLTTWRFVDAAYRRLDALPDEAALEHETAASSGSASRRRRSEEHTSELQSLAYLVCRLLLEKKKQQCGA